MEHEKTIPKHIQIKIKESEELLVKIKELDDFVANDSRFDSFCEAKKNLLITQYHAMCTYHQILLSLIDLES